MSEKEVTTGTDAMMEESDTRDREQLLQEIEDLKKKLAQEQQNNAKYIAALNKTAKVTLTEPSTTNNDHAVDDIEVTVEHYSMRKAVMTDDTDEASRLGEVKDNSAMKPLHKSDRSLNSTKSSLRNSDYLETPNVIVPHEGPEITAIQEETQCIKKRAVEAKRNQTKSIKDRFIEVSKYLISFALLIFSIVMVMGCIFKEESQAATYSIHPVGAFFLFWFLVFWLVFIEGGQGCIVGLQPINRDKYYESHLVSHQVTELAYRGDNLERYIVGRQFLVVLVIFLINTSGSAIKGADPFGLPKVVNDIFLGNGLAMMITTIVIGQLTSQINAAVCLLDFINNYLILFTTHLSLWIEFSGLLHSVYAVQILFTKLTGAESASNGLERTTAEKIFFWAKVLMSTIILGFCLAVTLQAILDENSGMWKGVPTWASIVIFITLMCLAGLMEGMQIAAFALLNVPEEELKKHSVAHTNCQLMFAGSNLQSFLIGRQIFVASLNFIVARIASIAGPEDYSIFGASPSLQFFYNTGLLGSVVLTIIGSLIWRIIASSCPLPFMSNPIIYVIIRMCLLLEESGLFASTWGLAFLHKKFAGFQPDEVYLREAEPQDESV